MSGILNNIYFRNACVTMLFLLFSVISLSQAPDKQVLPVDKDIRIGNLNNGMKYYIRKNSRPENRLEMRLVVHAGSVLEDEDQLGIAHFVEHMSFNGTKNFEKNKLIEYLQSVGVKFGPDINAYTSFDETVYMLTLPADSAKIIDTGFQVMEDWAHNLSFDHSEIDKERGVIIEEWRINRGAFQRMRDLILPVLLKDSRYANRLPIGQKEIIENVDYETIKRFYKDWYRPDLMAFIIVGDINVDTMEAKIKEQFSNLKPSKQNRKRVDFEIPDHNETLVAVATDKESPVTVVSLYYKSTSPKFQTYGDYRQMVLFSLYTGMLNQRLSELKELPEPPFINAGASFSEFLSNKHVFVSSALVSEIGVETGLKALITENERLKRHGFTESELERLKKVLLNQYERSYNERDKTESSAFAGEYIRNFLKNEPIPGIEFEYKYVEKILPTITLNEINALTNRLITPENLVIVVQAPEKDGLFIPGDVELLAIAENTQKHHIEPYEDKISGSTLMAFKPEKGRILFTKKLNDIGAVEYKLSNGARVVLKNTDFKNDEILFTAESPGGQSLYPEEDHQSAMNAASIMNESGVGEFSKTELQKLLAGKTVALSGSIGMYFEGLNGYASPKDIETLMQLIHLKFTSPRKDEDAFTSYINKQTAYYKNILSEPTQYFADQYGRIKAQNHPRTSHIPSEEQISLINLNRVYEIYKERFADASDFNFFFTGAINPDSIKPLIETYIASLPSLKRNEKWNDLGIRPPAGRTDTSIFKGSERKSIVINYFEKEIVWNEKDAYLLAVLGEILNRKYIEILREEMSGVYGVRASAGMGKIPYEQAWLEVMFPCSPDNADSLTQAVLNQIKKIQHDGITAEDVKTAREIQRRSIEENLKTNNHWIRSIQEVYRNNLSTDLLTKYNEILENITSEEIKRVANEYIDLEKYLRAVLYPEKIQLN